MERRFRKGRVGMITRKKDKQTVISGLAAVFYDGTPETEYVLWDYGEDDRAVERIMPGAFKRAIAEDDVRALFNHEPNLVLGRNTSGTLQLKETKQGLGYRIEPAETTASKDTQEHISRGDVDGSSFAFVIGEKGEQVWREKEGLFIREIVSVGQLFDVGPVTFPAYDASTAELNDARGGKDPAREAYEAWQAELRAAAAEGEKRGKRIRNKLLKLRLLGFAR